MSKRKLDQVNEKREEQIKKPKTDAAPQHKYGLWRIGTDAAGVAASFLSAADHQKLARCDKWLFSLLSRATTWCPTIEIPMACHFVLSPQTENMFNSRTRELQIRANRVQHMHCEHKSEFRSKPFCIRGNGNRQELLDKILKSCPSLQRLVIADNSCNCQSYDVPSTIQQGGLFHWDAWTLPNPNPIPEIVVQNWEQSHPVGRWLFTNENHFNKLVIEGRSWNELRYGFNIAQNLNTHTLEVHDASIMSRGARSQADAATPIQHLVFKSCSFRTSPVPTKAHMPELQTIELDNCDLMQWYCFAPFTLQESKKIKKITMRQMTMDDKFPENAFLIAVTGNLFVFPGNPEEIELDFKFPIAAIFFSQVVKAIADHPGIQKASVKSPDGLAWVYSKNSQSLTMPVN